MSVERITAELDALAARADRLAQHWPAPLDLRALADLEPQPPEMIIPDWLPCGYATLIAGHGGAGKSSIALYMAVCVALGRDFFGLETAPRRVLYLSCEDRTRVLHWRLNRICRHLGVSMAEVPIEVRDLVGHDSILWERTSYGGQLTAAFETLAAVVRANSIDVIVVDGVADTFAGSENDRGDIKRFVNALVSLIPADTGAVLLVHHVNKAGAGTATAEGYSGSTGWHNSVRARWYLYPETEQTDDGVDRTGRLILELQKSNLGKADQSMTFEWDDGAHLFVGESIADMSAVTRNNRDEDERDGILAAMREIESQDDYVPAAQQGQRTALHVLATAESFPETLKSKRDRRRFWRHIEHLRRIQKIRESSIRRPNGHRTATITLQATPNAGSVELPNTQDANATHIRRGAPSAELPNSAGGLRGRARADCPRCKGEGCDWCERKPNSPREGN